ncbi:MAG: transcriptional regulator [Clostridium sp.]|nr:transcriptional regulator [Clostridium sp.]
MYIMVKQTINFLSNTFPEIYSNFYLNYLKQYSEIHNIKKTELKALVFLKGNEKINMTELCSKLNIEKGSLTSLIDNLSKKGYVCRKKTIKDRRKYIIVLTEQGNEIAIDFIEKLSTNLEKKFKKLNKKDRNNYLVAIKVLEKLADI